MREIGGLLRKTVIIFLFLFFPDVNFFSALFFIHHKNGSGIGNHVTNSRPRLHQGKNE